VSGLASDVDDDPQARLKALEDLKAGVDKNDFAAQYQRWYSRALPAIEQVLPDRYVEFREFHRLDKRPKELDVTTYTISDYLQGTRVTTGYGAFKEEVFDSTRTGLAKFKSQIDILSSASSRLDSRLSDITSVVEASLLDDEIERVDASRCGSQGDDRDRAAPRSGQARDRGALEDGQGSADSGGRPEAALTMIPPRR